MSTGYHLLVIPVVHGSEMRAVTTLVSASRRRYESRPDMLQALNSLINFIQEAREAHLEIANQ